MHFDQPLWILAAVFGCTALFVIHLHLEKKRRKRLHSFAAASLISSLTGSVSHVRRRIKLVLVLTACFVSLLALARPQYGHRWIDVKRRGIDILFAVDTSASMLAQDIRPNRLERSRLAILDFVERLDGDRVGLMPFAGSAFLLCPLTIDYTAFAETLQALDTTIIPEPGTDLEDAIDEAARILDNDANHKLLVILTDGENLEGDALAAADRARRQGMTIFTVGVGTREGELVPVAPPGADEHSSGYIKDEQGQYVISRLDESGLRRISSATDGLYAPLGSRGQGLESIYNRKLTLIPKEELAERRQKVPVERFPWFLGMALFLLMLEYLVTGRKSPPPTFSPPWKRRKTLPAVMLLSLVTSLATPSPASTGEEAFNNGEYQAAARYYEELLAQQPEDVIHYNYGTAAYKSRRYDEAIAAFTKALHSDDPELQEKAYFNRGNAHFKKGEQSLQGDVDSTVDQWLKALKSYEAALGLQPEDIRARNNHQIVRKKLETLQKQQQNRQNTEENSGDRHDSEASSEQRRRQQADSEKPQQGQSPENDRQKAAPEKSAEDDAGQNGSKDIGSLPDEPLDGRQDERKRPAEHARRQPRQDALNKRQALQLLEEMKNEEGRLDFIPQQRQNIPQKRGKNW